MKFLALLCIIAASGILVSGEGFSSGDLYSGSGAAPSTAPTTISSSNEIPFAEATVEADRHFDSVNHGNKKQIVKRHGLKPDHRSKSLFRGMEDVDLTNEASVARFQETVSRDDLISMLEFGAGPNWNDYYELPAEELSLLEVAELSAELNDRNIRAAYAMETRSPGWNGSYKKGPGICFCHGTAHHYFSEATAAKGQDKGDSDFKGFPYYGNRMFKFGGIPFGHDNQEMMQSHNSNPYFHRDCVLTTAEYSDSSYKHCCVGFCAINPVAPYGNIPSTVVPTLFQCDQTSSDVLAGGKSIAQVNEFLCERPCNTDDCTCEEVESAIVTHGECNCEERIANNNNCQCATDNTGGIDWDTLSCGCDLLLEDVPDTGANPCTCAEGMFNRGCNCGDQTATGKTFSYIDDKFNCGCDDFFSAGIRQECSCDLALNLCDGSCCDFYEETATECTDEVHASFIGAQVSACPCDNTATLNPIP